MLAGSKINGNNMIVGNGRFTETIGDKNRIILNLENYFLTEKYTTPDNSVAKTINQNEIARQALSIIQKQK